MPYSYIRLRPLFSLSICTILCVLFSYFPLIFLLFRPEFGVTGASMRSAQSPRVRWGGVCMHGVRSERSGRAQDCETPRWTQRTYTHTTHKKHPPTGEQGRMKSPQSASLEGCLSTRASKELAEWPSPNQRGATPAHLTACFSCPTPFHGAQVSDILSHPRRLLCLRSSAFRAHSHTARRKCDIRGDIRHRAALPRGENLQYRR